MNDKFLKPYNPQETEDTIYKKWEASGLFNPDESIKQGFTKKDAEPFSIVLPPPNVTGTLHMGSALMIAIEDILVRYNRLLGKRTLWLPGTDHAAIATQTKVEKQLEKEEKKRRHDLGREEFLKRVEKFAQESHDTIVTQIRKMGASVDWSREAYTLDEARNKAVRTAFKKMYDDGLMYRGYRIVNWDPKGQTTISDDEIVYEERKGKLYTFKYSPDFPIAIATTRPETKLGDTAVAVHPTDERYKQFIGKTYTAHFAGAELSIKIVGDEAVDPTFGTGAVGVTPAHSQTDWEIAQRHQLPTVPVINEYAKMTVGMEGVIGKKTTEAREAVVTWLTEHNLLEKEEEITMNISTAERSGGIIEPLPKLQWFVNVTKPFTLPHSEIEGITSGSVTTLKELMRAVVTNGQTTVIPDRFSKIYLHWIDNLRDWNVSRQIWFGHRIPAWYKDKEVFVGLEAPQEDGWIQDKDSLDTWFSSGLWTFSTLGWPEHTEDLKTYHPTTVIETGYDILFFWIARMILMSTYLLGTIPFKTVYLHGLVRDTQGRKISKSLGNNIDPVDMINKYGSDAVRLSLIIGTGPGNDSKMSEDKIRAYKNFANKIWNASRFVFEHTDSTSIETQPELTEIYQTYISQFTDTIKEVTTDTDNFRFYLAAEKLYHYFWHTFADIIIEKSKADIQNGSEAEKTSARYTLRYVLINSLKALHPFMPFVTEEIWSSIPEHKHMLMVDSWPITND